MKTTYLQHVFFCDISNNLSLCTVSHTLYTHTALACRRVYVHSVTLSLPASVIVSNELQYAQHELYAVKCWNDRHYVYKII